MIYPKLYEMIRLRSLLGDSFDVFEHGFGIMQMHFESTSFLAHLRVLLEVTRMYLNPFGVIWGPFWFILDVCGVTNLG